MLGYEYIYRKMFFRGTYARIYLLFLAALTFIILMLGLSYLTLFLCMENLWFIAIICFLLCTLLTCLRAHNAFQCFRPIFVNVCGILLLFKLKCEDNNLFKGSQETKEDIFLFFYPKNVQFSEKGPEIGFSSLFSNNAKWLRLFHQTVLDENKGTLFLLTIHFISKSSAQKSKFLNFGKKALKQACLDLNNLFFFLIFQTLLI